ncbi:MAG TPA: DUF4301 domain-containing protein [Bacteroidales bacterium]|nr:DUF4301 domain-containing protein [Bacteroidales bacterium]
MFTENDVRQIQEKGLTTKEVENQILNFTDGFPWLDISKPAIVNDGIIRLTENETDAYIKLFEDINPDSLKFVPASGAASRMFKFLFEFYEKAQDKYDSINQIKDTDVKKFFIDIKKFAFYNELRFTIKKNNLDIEDLIKQGRYKEVLRFFLFDDGLNYGQKPKGILLFHKNNNDVITAFEEHLIEGIHYAKSPGNKVKIHFTISPEHIDLFNTLVSEKVEKLEAQCGVKFEISFSQQKPSTDMVAVDLENELFRNEDGSLLFRPGGHGALIENLNDLDSDIIFIKNIDNVVPVRLIDITVKYKKALAGVLLSFQERIFEYIHILESNDFSDETKKEIEEFIKEELCVHVVHYEKIESRASTKCLLEILNRPVRVCGMVKNEGEPGGGPFWVKLHNGNIDLQIVESSQINADDKRQMEILKASTHFNPVDLVCATKNYLGEKFDLLKFRDPNTGFISKKSKDGKDIKAQELPGLWNGAMAKWNTIFVEVPIVTFNPVKTINDLLRPEHQ